MNHSEIVSLLWDVANLIRDSFKRGKYQDVILPLTVLRRLDCVQDRLRKHAIHREGHSGDAGRHVSRTCKMTLNVGTCD